MILEITPNVESVVIFIAKKQHESLIRIHEGKAHFSSKFPEILARLGMTEDDYLEYASESFYQFQRLIENPKLLSDMPIEILGVVLELALNWEDELFEIAGYDFVEFVKNLITRLELTSTNLNLN